MIQWLAIFAAGATAFLLVVAIGLNIFPPAPRPRGFGFQPENDE